jgi:hypothetical protein
MLEIVITGVGLNERGKAGKLAKELDEIKIKVTTDYSRGYCNLKFSCPNSLALTQEQEKKFGEVLEKIFYYEKRSTQPSKNKIDYGLANVALKKRQMFLEYGAVRFYLENLQTYDLK